MSTLEELDDLDRRDRDDKDKKDGGDDKGKGNKKPSGDGDDEMKDAPEEENVLDDEILQLGTQDILNRRRLLDNDARIMKSEFQRLQHEKATMNEKIKENREKIQNNRSVTFPNLPPICCGWARLQQYTDIDAPTQATPLPRRQRRRAA